MTTRGGVMTTAIATRGAGAIITNGSGAQEHSSRAKRVFMLNQIIKNSSVGLGYNVAAKA